MQRETEAGAPGASWGLLESLPFEENWKRAVSHWGKCSKLFLGEKHKK